MRKRASQLLGGHCPVERVRRSATSSWDFGVLFLPGRACCLSVSLCFVSLSLSLCPCLSLFSLSVFFWLCLFLLSLYLSVSLSLCLCPFPHPPPARVSLLTQVLRLDPVTGPFPQHPGPSRFLPFLSAPGHIDLSQSASLTAVLRLIPALLSSIKK